MKNKQINILSKNTGRKILLFLNKTKKATGGELKASSFNRFSIEELNHMANQLRFNNKTIKAEEIYFIQKLINSRIIKDNNLLSAGEKSAAVRQLNKQAKQEFLELERLEFRQKKQLKVIEDLQRESGVITEGAEKLKLIKHNIPQEAIAKYTPITYAKAALNQELQLLAFSGDKLKVSEEERFEQLKQEYIKAAEYFKDFNLETVKEEYNNYFLKDGSVYNQRGIFKNMFLSLQHAGYDKELMELEELMKYLNIQQMEDLKRVIKSEKFLKLYDSDQDNIMGSMEYRLEGLLKILRQTTGKDVRFKQIKGTENYKISSIKNKSFNYGESFNIQYYL